MAERYKRVKLAASIANNAAWAAKTAIDGAGSDVSQARAAYDTAAADGAPNLHDFAEKLELARATQSAVAAANVGIAERAATLNKVVKSVDKFLKSAKGEIVEAEPVEARAVDPAELSALIDRKRAVDAMMPSLEETHQNWVRFVDKTASPPTPFMRTLDIGPRSDGSYTEKNYLDFDFPKRQIESPYPEHKLEVPLAATTDALALICWLFPDRMKEHFTQKATEYYELHVDEALSSAEKRDELARLDHQILRLQMMEAEAAFAKSELVLREGLDPRAVLGCEVIR